MKIVVLEKMSLGFDVDISFYEEFGEVTYYDTTRPEEIETELRMQTLSLPTKHH